MPTQAKSVDEYINQLPDERKEAISKLREVILKNLPKGFEETISYRMIGYVVPHSIYPDGYHCDPELPLPFINIASQKKHITVYHSGLYADERLMEWFKTEFAKLSAVKLDMGKSCIRFKKPEHIPYNLIGKLVGKMTAADWIKLYESVIKNK